MKFLFSMRMAVLVLFLFAFSIGVATFIENDYGTQSAQALIYKATWFELFLLYFSLILAYNMVKTKSYKTKLPVFLFHLSFLVIALGALVTRYIGYEGIMHIREGASANTIVSAEKFLEFSVEEGQEVASHSEALYLSSLGHNSIKRTLEVNNKQVHFELLEYMPSFTKSIVEDAQGKAMVELMVSAGAKGESILLSRGEVKHFGQFSIAYEAEVFGAKSTLVVQGGADGLVLSAPFKLETMRMDDSAKATLQAGKHPFHTRTLYQFNGNAVVLKKAYPSARIGVKQNSLKTNSKSPELLRFKVSVEGKEQIVDLKPRAGKVGQVEQVSLGGLSIKLRAGAKRIPLPFALRLDDFQLERYPGSSTPSSYASRVTLFDKEQNLTMPHHIYMNNILDHRGYRFFQSSYDMDEKGTILSVNHDPGTLPTYIGYLLMTIGMIWALFSKKGRFMTLLRGTRKLKSGALAFVSLALFAFVEPTYAATGPVASPKALESMQAYDKAHAKAFGTLVVQDYRGRMKPLDTLAREAISKITGKSKPFGLSANRLFLGMIMEPEFYQKQACISLGGKTTKQISKILTLPKESRYATFEDFFTKEGAYKIYDAVSLANQKRPIERSVLDKELINLDERVNVSHMVFSGRLLRIIPKPDDPNNTWLSPMEAIEGLEKGESSRVKLGVTAYFYAVGLGVKNNKWDLANKALAGLKQYQAKYGSDVLLSKEDVALEVSYNELSLFAKLVPYYILLGLALLILAFVQILKPTVKMQWVMKGTLGLLALGFLVHVAGLGLRWYISGHAPWSDAYESLIFIAVTTVLAGMLLARHSLFALGASTLLAGLTMGVAHLSFINPEITNLVPVLKSYWLLIHVATIVSSYGFLGLGSMLSLLVLVLYLLINEKRAHIKTSIKELTALSEMSLIIGLFLLTIGNFLGGIWANESWGRYWGWDAKETWAAVTILVYATILHLRFVPLLKSNYMYHVASMWGYASVIMTYFGVNYYLSGLHSYAAGDPVPIPVWIYYFIATLALISLLAWRKRNSLK